MKTNLLLQSANQLSVSAWARRGVGLATLLSLGLGAHAQNPASSATANQATPTTRQFAGMLISDGVALQRTALKSATISKPAVATPVASAVVASPWAAAAPLSQARSEHAAEAAAGKIYVWGGYIGDGSRTLSSLEIYDAAANTWSSGAALPIATRGQASAVGADGAIYSFGGVSNSGLLSSSYRYSPGTGVWAAIAPLPTAVWEASAARAADGRIYVFGGESAGTSNQVYTPSTNTWSAGAAAPTSRHGHSTVRDANGLLHVIGGVLNSNSVATTTHEVYNPTTNTWTTATPLPMAVNQAGATLGADGNIYVVGGKQSYFNNDGPFYSTTYVYAPSTNTWTQGPDLPQALGELQAATVGTSVYTLAGTNGTQQNVVYQLAVGLSTLVDANSAANTVVQNAAAGTAVGITASSTDPNGQTVTYSLLDNAGGRFAINATTGVVSVAAGAQFPTAPITYTITVQASNGSATTSGSFSIDVTAPPVVAASISVQYQTGDFGQPTDNQLRPFLQLVNSGTTAVPYSSLTIRYWLTVENFMGQLVTPIDYAKLGTSFVSARYVALATPRQGALGYIEYSFAAGAGNLNPGTDSGPIYGKAYKPDYTNFDETDDWSYQTSSSFTTNSHVTVYQNGTLVNGTEPTAVTATTALNVFSASRDASTSTSYISVQVQVRNTGNVPVNYGDVRARYYFTRDGATTVVPQIDYAKLGNSNVSLRVVNLAAPVSGADAYLEVTFSAALGLLYPRTGTDDILLKLRKDNYQAFDQSNDYTFSGSTALAVNNRFPAYVSNQLVFGTPPAGAPSVVAPTQEASARASAADAAATSASLALALTASPNPFSDNVQLSFALPQAEAYTLAVYDLQGRLLEELPGGTAEAGVLQQVAWSVSRYAAGLYLVRLVTPSTSQQFRLMKK